MLYFSNPEQLLTRDQLALFLGPPPTRTHRPVKHFDLANALEAAVEDRGMTIAKEEWMVTNNHRLYGSVELTPPSGLILSTDVTPCIGVRHANDKSMSLQLMAGGRVRVCQNGLFLNEHGEMIRRRHTSGLNVMEAVGECLDQYLVHLQELDTLCQRLKAARLSEMRAKAVLHDLFFEHRVLKPVYLPAVAERYFHDPEHVEQFGTERNRFTLMQAVTQVAKTVSAPVQMQAHKRLGKALLAGLN